MIMAAAIQPVSRDNVATIFLNLSIMDQKNQTALAGGQIIPELEHSLYR